MGISNNAILVLGIDVEEDVPEWLEDYDCLDDLILSLAGLEDEPDHDKRQAAIDACPVEQVEHCSRDCEMTILAVRSTQIMAYRGYPKEVEPASMLDVSRERIEAFKDWLNERGMSGVDLEPSWLLCSMNG